MSGKRTSPIWMMPKDEFKKLVEMSKTQREVLAAFGLQNKGNNNVILKKRAKEEGIELSFPPCHTQMVLANRKRAKPTSEILKEGSTYSRHSLKRRLLREGIKENVCELCGQKPQWMGKPLVMILDHANGDCRDNRVENLRMVCPNCNSQLPTHAGRNQGKRKSERKCSGCGRPIFTYSKTGLCVKCLGVRRRSTKRPPPEQLEEEISELGLEGTGRKYGVTGNAVRKWAKVHGIK